jgi:hypothetical protein
MRHSGAVHEQPEGQPHRRVDHHTYWSVSGLVGLQHHNPSRGGLAPWRLSFSRDRECRNPVELDIFRGPQTGGEEMIEGNCARSDNDDHDEDDEVGKFVEADKVEQVMKVRELGGQNGDDHAHDERKGREPRRQADHEQRPSNELAVPHHHGVEARRGDMEALEERRDLGDTVNFAPTGRHEQKPDGQAPKQRSEPAQAFENRKRAGPQCLKESHRTVHRTDLSRAGTAWSYGPALSKLHAPAALINGAHVLGTARMAAACALAACTLLACGAAKPQATESAGNPPSVRREPAVAWTYEVQAQGIDLASLAIEATFAPTSATALAAEDEAAPFVGGVEFFSAGRWTPAPSGEGTWSAPCLASGCRVRYTFALGNAASTIAGVDTALAAGGVIVAPPSTWLLRPVGETATAADSLLRFRVAGTRFASGMARSTSAPDFFEASTSDIDAASFAVFGPFREETVRSGTSSLELAIAPSGLEMAPSDVKAWLERAVLGLADYYGRFPTPRALVVVVPGTAGETEGETLGDGGPSVVILAARGLTTSRTRDDWVMIHELIHVTLPSLGRRQAWLSEGLATYVEPIVRARAGIVTVQRFWSDLVKGLPQGLPEPGDQGLERTHTWGRTYWGGALFCLIADVRIREATHGARSLDDALRSIVATGANVASHWSVDQFLDQGDRGAGVTVLRDLYREMGLAPGTVDLEALWKRLGVRVGPGGSVAFDDRSELASVRRAIAAPKLKD